MTNLELQLKFTQRLRNHLDNVIDIRTIDIEYYLSEGLRKFVDLWYLRFEFDEASRKRLNSLVDTAILTADYGGSFVRSLAYILPENCKYVVQERCTLNLLDCHGAPTIKEAVKVKPVKLNYYNFHINNPFKKPYKDLVWRMDIGNKIHILIYGEDTINITNYYITYIKNPNPITLLSGTPETTVCEISEEFHEEILDKAVETAIEIFNLTNSFKTNQQ